MLFLVIPTKEGSLYSNELLEKHNILKPHEQFEVN